MRGLQPIRNFLLLTSETTTANKKLSSTNPWEDDSQWEAYGSAESAVAHDELLLDGDLVSAAQVDEEGEEEGAEEAVDEAGEDGGQDETGVEVVWFLQSIQI